ncbi:MAG: Uma2 family endonuclease [Desulfococcaceae bacterium]|jgi:Uma2 family endonuclease|nr:Uma2 family endonuclease [Desulfococcaceae bacterium]
MQHIAKKTENIPESFIYEMVRGTPVYYKRSEIISESDSSVGEVMGSSFLQAQLVAIIVGILFGKLDLNKYVITTNETGFRYAENSFRALDIAVFEREKVTKELLSEEYVKTAPEIVIEVDIKADLNPHGDMMYYMNKKTEDLLNAGVKKLIWIMTRSKKVMIAKQGEPWILAGWDYNIALTDKLSINMKHILDRISGD